MNPGVFISHKLNDAPTEDFLAKLRPDLEALGCHVWVDTDIAPAEVWRQELSAWMSQCSCAVLLISRKALDSPWMFQEASILSWRQEQDRNFKLFPVVIDGLTDDEISASPLKVVLEILRLQSPGRNGTNEEKVRKTVAAVKNHQLARRDDGNEFTRTAWEIAKLLAGSPPGALETAAEKLDIKLGSWVPGWDPNYVFSLELLASPPHQMRDALDLLGILPAIKGRIGKMALPFWVDVNAAGIVGRTARESGGRPLLLLNADYPETAGDYVARARFSPGRSWYCHSYSNIYGEDFKGELWDEICGCIALSLGEEIDSSRADDRRSYVEDLTSDVTQDSRQFVAIDIRKLRKPADWSDLEKLRKNHSSVIYLLLTGPLLPTETELDGALVRPLRPEVAAGLEGKIRGLRGRFIQDSKQSSNPP